MRSFFLSGTSLLAILVCTANAAATPFLFTGSIQEFTVPTTGTYDITAAGAQGGPGDRTSGGLGATVSGDVTSDGRSDA